MTIPPAIIVFLIIIFVIVCLVIIFKKELIRLDALWAEKFKGLFGSMTKPPPVQPPEFYEITLPVAKLQYKRLSPSGIAMQEFEFLCSARELTEAIAGVERLKEMSKDVSEEPKEEMGVGLG